MAGRPLLLPAAALLVAALLPGSARAHCVPSHDFGCFVDQIKPRLLGGPALCEHKTNATASGCRAMTPALCAQWCAAQQMPIAGVENGDQCFCDKLRHGEASWAPKHPGKAAAPPTDCSHPCAGDKEVMCGGRDRIQVFNYSCSGPPDPVPPPAPPPPTHAVYPNVKPCDQPPLKGSPACDASVPLETRVQTVVSMLPPADFAAMFSDQSPGSPTLNIPFYNWWSEALHGVSRCPYENFLPANESVSGSCCARAPDGSKKCPTSFPAGITTSASFNRTLFHEIGTAVGTEARVMSNVGIASLTFWTPNVNIFRDPRWGRGQ